MKRVSFIFFCLFLTSVQIQSQMISVPGDQPTIQAAINAATDGDTVIVVEGTYYENINFRGKAIVVGSEFLIDNDTSHISRTIIDGSQASDPDSASVVIMCYGEDTTSVIKGFTLTGGTGTNVSIGNKHGHNGGGVCSFNSRGKVEWNIIRDNQLIYENYEDGLYIGGAGILGGGVIRKNVIMNNVSKSGYGGAGSVNPLDNGVLIENNEIIGNEYSGQWGVGGGIALYSAEGSGIIRNNLIKDNKILSESTFMRVAGGGIWLQNSNSMQVYNNIVAGNHCDRNGGGMAFLACGDGAFVFNNTIVDNTSGEEGSALFVEDFNGAVSKVIAYNNIICSGDDEGEDLIYILQGSTLITRNNSVCGGWDVHWDIDAEPAFLPDSFGLSETSLCVDRGTELIMINEDVYEAPTHDMAGKPRKYGERIDLGALESEFAQVDYFEITHYSITESQGGPGNGSVSFSFAGGTPPFEFYLNEDAFQDTILQDVGAGEYTLYIRDDDSHELSLPFTIVGSADLKDPFTHDLIVYPNPAMSDATIVFSLNRNQHVHLSLVNLLGQEVTLLMDEDISFGTRSLQIDVSCLSRGIYFLRLEGEQTLTRKLIVN